MFHFIPQLEHSDCGIACIRMLARHYGKIVSSQELQQQADSNRLGMSIKDISECFSFCQMKSAALKLEAPSLYRMPLPAICHWNQNHFVVLYKASAKRKTLYVADPSKGKYRLKEEDFLENWLTPSGKHGTVILAEPDDGFKKTPRFEFSLERKLLNYIAPIISKNRWKYTLAILVAVLITCCDIYFPFLVKNIFDKGIPLGDIGIILSVMFAQAALLCGRAVSATGIDVALTKMGLKLNLKMSETFIQKLLSFPVSFFDKKVSSDFIQKLEDQGRIKDFIVSFPSNLFVSVLSLIIFSGLLLFFSWEIFLVVYAFAAIEIIWTSLFNGKRRGLDYRMFQSMAICRNHAFEISNGIEEIKVNNAESRKLAQWNSLQSELNETTIKAKWTSVADSTTRTILVSIKEILVSGLCAIFVIKGYISLGTMMTISYIVGRLSSPFSTVSNSISMVQSFRLSYERIQEFLSPVKKENKTAPISDDIIFRDVWFKYPGSTSPFVLKGISANIKKGQTTAIVGESGCGKTTLLKIMLGFYTPTAGSAILGGIDQTEIDLASWLGKIGCVQQSGQIFTGTIADNISMNEEEPDRFKLIETLRIVGLLEFVESLPLKLSTRIGVSGVGLSGGQKQRLMIARALYKNPRILFMDEATSSLDATTEKRIVDNIREFSEGRTLVIAAHRLSTVIDADNILFIKNGEIAEQGTHSELIEQKGEYWNLVRNQLQLAKG